MLRAPLVTRAASGGTSSAGASVETIDAFWAKRRIVAGRPCRGASLACGPREGPRVPDFDAGDRHPRPRVLPTCSARGRGNRVQGEVLGRRARIRLVADQAVGVL